MCIIVDWLFSKFQGASQNMFMSQFMISLALVHETKSCAYIYKYTSCYVMYESYPDDGDNGNNHTFSCSWEICQLWVFLEDIWFLFTIIKHNNKYERQMLRDVHRKVDQAYLKSMWQAQQKVPLSIIERYEMFALSIKETIKQAFQWYQTYKNWTATFENIRTTHEPHSVWRYV